MFRQATAEEGIGANDNFAYFQTRLFDASTNCEKLKRRFTPRMLSDLLGNLGMAKTDLEGSGSKLHDKYIDELTRITTSITDFCTKYGISTEGASNSRQASTTLHHKLMQHSSSPSMMNH